MKMRYKWRSTSNSYDVAIYDDDKFRNCAWVAMKLNEQEAEIARLKGLCQDYHSEADSRDAEIEKLHSENSWKQMRIEIQGEAVVKLEAQLAAHQEFVKAFDAWEERDLQYVDTALDKARKALEDK